MDVGSITRVKSARMNDTVILYHSVRQVGFVYKFNFSHLVGAGHCCECGTDPFQLYVSLLKQ